MRRFYIFILLFISSSPSIFAQSSTVDQFFTSGALSTASYSIYAIDANTGAKICASVQKSLSTASVMKLFTTAVALDLLGPEFTFSTSLSYSGNLDPKTGLLKGNLILKGGGDPAFYSTYFQDEYQDCFEKWIVQIKKCGIKSIDGQLLLDLSAFDRTTIPGGWGWADIGNYYGTGVSALTYNDNLYEIHFTSPKLTGLLATIKSKNPEIVDLTLESQVYSSAKSGDQTIVYGAPGSTHQYIEGTIPTDQTDFVVKAAMPDPALQAGNTLLQKIRKSGIHVSGGVAKVQNQISEKRTTIAIQLSPPLKDLIVPLNKESLNLFAEHLLREAGRKYLGEPSIPNGIKAYRKFCAEKGINDAGFFPADGSGLSRSNALTAQTLVETIKYEYDSKNSELFFNALPVAGIDGTLKNSFKGTPLEKNVRAKTGSLERVRSLAGSLKSKKHRTILFAILINNYPGTSAETSKLLESILLSFYND